MKVKTKEYFHIHKIGPKSSIWKVGNLINWRKIKINQFNNHFNIFNYDYNDGSGKKYLIDAMNKFYLSDQKYKNKHIEKLLSQLCSHMLYQGKYVRETIFEKVRAENFSHLPSRLNSIWICDEKGVEFWWKKLWVPKNILFKLELSGEIHIGEESFLEVDTFTHEVYKKNAFEYWSGSVDLDNPELEILFNGEFRIIEEYKTIEEFKNRK